MICHCLETVLDIQIPKFDKSIFGTGDQNITLIIKGQRGNRAFVAFELVKASLVDHIPHDDMRVSRARGQSVALGVEGQGRHCGFVAVESYDLVRIEGRVFACKDQN